MITKPPPGSTMLLVLPSSFCIVDESKIDMLSERKWHLAHGRVMSVTGRRELLEEAVTGSPGGKAHNNGDGRDYRESNLSEVRAPNKSTYRPRRNAGTGLYGVSLCNGRYKVDWSGTPKTFLGYFWTAKEAARVWDSYADSVNYCVVGRNNV